MPQAVVITILNENDVLYGRGSGICQYIGNKRFRDVCEARKDEYNSAAKNKVKGEIAQQVIDQIHSRGGRFLQLQESSNDSSDAFNELWAEVDEKKALDKVKQTLRQRVTVSLSSRLNQESLQEAREQTSGGIVQLLQGPVAVVLSGASDASLNENSGLATTLLATRLSTPAPAQSLLPVLPPTLAGMVDPRLALLQATAPLNPYLRALLSGQAIRVADNNTFQQQQQAELAASTMLTTTLFPNLGTRAEATPSVPRFMNDGRLQPIYPGITLQGQQQADTVSSRYGSVATSAGRSTAETDFKRQNMPPSIEIMNKKPTANASVLSMAANDDDVSEFLLSALGLSDLPRFTDHEEEKASMTDEERAAALADVFGKYCSVDVQKNKRARRDLDPESIAFLVKHMRSEIAKVPKDEKLALIEAQEKCEPEEFSDARLERFLRCVGMDVSRATCRFVKYWKMRREVFGPDKFTLPMTLSGALRDDLVALQTSWLSLLPKCDSSGRQLLYMVPSRHKREGYTSESLLRAGWYVIEVASQSEANIVWVQVWDKDSTIFDFDRYLYENFFFLQSECWPVKFECTHSCYSPKLVSRVILPVLSAFLSKQSRFRLVIHNVPEGEILSALSDYGITKEMLPQQMGGTLFDHSEWIALRRAAELGEI